MPPYLTKGIKRDECVLSFSVTPWSIDLRSCCSFLGEDVEFWIIIGRELVYISTRLDDSLVTLFTHLRNHVDTAEFIPAISYRKCEFYQLKNPVSMVKDRSQPDDVFLDRVNYSRWWSNKLKQQTQQSLAQFERKKKVKGQRQKPNDIPI